MALNTKQQSSNVQVLHNKYTNANLAAHLCPCCGISLLTRSNATTSIDDIQFLAAKAQLNTCTCDCVCLSVVKTEFLPVYTIVQLVTDCDSFVMFRLCAFPLCPFVPLYAPFTPSHVMFCLCAFPLCPFVPLYALCAPL